MIINCILEYNKSASAPNQIHRPDSIEVFDTYTFSLSLCISGFISNQYNPLSQKKYLIKCTFVLHFTLLKTHLYLLCKRAKKILKHRNKPQPCEILFLSSSF